jgi:hypothetical protein
MFDKDAVQRKFGRILTSVTRELSKCITVITVSDLSECPNCYIDTVTGKSTGVCKHGSAHPNYFKFGRCPVCKGGGAIEYENKVYVNATVLWKGAGSSSSSQNDLVFNSYGMQGMCIAKLKTGICHLNLFKSCDYVIVDGVKCTVYNPPVIRGLGGKHILIVYVHGDDKINDNETTKPTSSF